MDSSVIVDLLREYQPAELWLQAQGTLGIARIVWIEILEGATNRKDQHRAVKLLRRFETVEIEAQDAIWATQTLTSFGLSHGVDGYDCLIAAVSYRLQASLYTRNMKHFTPMIGALAIRPY